MTQSTQDKQANKAKLSNNALQRMLQPSSIAIVGASSDLNKVSGRPLKYLLDKGYKGAIYPINPKAVDIAGVKAVPDIASLPDGVDLAVVVLPAEQIEATVLELAKKKVPVAVVFASGFGEMGSEGKAMEASLQQAAQKAGIRVLGPNCLGLFNAFNRAIATFSQYADGEMNAGPVGFISQSGAFGTAICALSRARQMGFGFFVNTGNEVDISVMELMQEMLALPELKVCSGYLEGLNNGHALASVAEQAMQLDKPIVLTKVGRFGAGARAAASHTGSLAGEDRVFDGLVQQKGIVRARNEEHMLDIVEVLLHCERPSGKNLAIITQSGGAGVLLADRAEEVGLNVPALSETTRKAIAQVIPGFGATGNPVDVTAQFVAQPSILTESTIIALNDPDIDVGVVWLQLMHGATDKLLEVFAEIKSRAKKPFVVVWVSASEKAIAGLRERGIVVFRNGDAAVDALAAVAQYAQARRRWQADQRQRHPLSAKQPQPAGVRQGDPVPTMQALALLKAFDIPSATAELVTSADAAVEAANRIAPSGAVALKIESMDVLHKTDVGGVVLNVSSDEAIRQAYLDITEHVKKVKPQARQDGILVQAMSSGRVEFILGLKRDPVFGMVIMMGLGGVWIEVLKDVVFCQCPVTPAEATDALGRLKGAALLEAFRGQPAVNKEALIQAIVNLSMLGKACEDWLSELDLNPILLSDKGLVAVDVAMVA